jgi:hypothetical protein
MVPLRATKANGATCRDFRLEYSSREGRESNRRRACQRQAGIWELR